MGGRVAGGVEEGGIEIGEEGSHSCVHSNVWSVSEAWFLVLRGGAKSRVFEDFVGVVAHVVVLVVVVAWASSGVAAVEVERLGASLTICVWGVKGESKA